MSWLSYQCNVAFFDEALFAVACGFQIEIIYAGLANLASESAVPTIFNVFTFKDFLAPSVVDAEDERQEELIASHIEDVVLAVAVGRESVGYKDEWLFADHFFHFDTSGVLLATAVEVGNGDRVAHGALRCGKGVGLIGVLQAL